MKGTLTLQGFSEFKGELLEWMQQFPELQEEIITDLGLFFEFNAKAALDQMGAVDTGRLKASIGHFTPQDTTNPAAVESDAHFKVSKVKGGVKVEVGTNVFYAPYVEFGTSKMAARPFMEFALRATEDYLPEAVFDKLKSLGFE